MPKIFGDHMVLQRNDAVKLWGTALPNAIVSVTFGEYNISTKANKKGDWKISLPPMSANKDGKNLIVSENGKINLEFKDVLVGEVWLVSGQSNMQWAIASLNDANEIVKSANSPMLRYFKQSSDTISQKPQSDFDKSAMWIKCDKNSVKEMSAIGYFFGDKLSKDLDTPVGVIYAAKGGTRIESWIPEASAHKDAKTYTLVKTFNKDLAVYDEKAYQAKLDERAKKLAEYHALCQQAKKEGKKQPAKHWTLNVPINRLTPYNEVETPYFHFNAKIAPMIGYTIKGVLWYQGESNTREGRDVNYDKQVENLFSSWRELWKSNFNVIVIGLASYDRWKVTKWANLRWNQYNATKKLGNAYFVNIIDCGEANEIHPQDKEIVATRSEKTALYWVYKNNDVKAIYAIPESYKFNGDKVIIKYNLKNSKFAPKGKARGFDVLVNGKWIDAKASLENDVLTITSSDGAKIEAVRYLWKNWAKPDVWLVDDAGNPALPFIKEN